MFKVQRMRFCCLGASPRKCVWKITRTLICPLSVFLLRCEMIDAKVVCALQGQQMLSAVTARDTATRAAALFLHSGSTKFIVEELRPFTWAQRSCDLTRGVGGDSQSAAAGVEESAIWNACPWISSMCIGCQGGVQSQWDITWCVRHRILLGGTGSLLTLRKFKFCGIERTSGSIFQQYTTRLQPPLLPVCSSLCLFVSRAARHHPAHFCLSIFDPFHIHPQLSLFREQ